MRAASSQAVHSSSTCTHAASTTLCQPSSQSASQPAGQSARPLNHRPLRSTHLLCSFCGARWVTLNTAPSLSSASSSSTEPHMLHMGAGVGPGTGRLGGGSDDEDLPHRVPHAAQVVKAGTARPRRKGEGRRVRSRGDGQQSSAGGHEAGSRAVAGKAISQEICTASSRQAAAAEPIHLGGQGPSCTRHGQAQHGK